jgi:hypothetical protein
LKNISHHKTSFKNILRKGLRPEKLEKYLKIKNKP